MRGQHDVDDVVTDAYLGLWRILRRGDVEHPRALLFKIAENKAKNLHRTVKRRNEVSYGLLEDLHSELKADFSDSGNGYRNAPTWARHIPLTCDRYEFAESFDEAVRELSGETRDAFILTELRGLTDREAAPLLGASHMTIHRRAEAARRSVREEIA